jgi:protein-tyrosine kinase
MDQIREALERAKMLGPTAEKLLSPAGPVASGLERSLRPSASTASSSVTMGRSRLTEVEIDRPLIESHRIVAHQASDPRSRSFDMLRTQVLQTMDQRNWQIVAVTSPTAGCGKTLTSINLALSIARQPERGAFLLDLDLHKPQVASCLGIKPKFGAISVLEGRASVADATTLARIGAHHLMVLPTENRVVDSSELIGSRAMGKMLLDIKRDFPTRTVIIDLPPILVSDDVIALLPQIDCVLLVAAVGTSTVSEIKECHNHLQSTPVLRTVLNKASEQAARYY